jgi:ADP-ribose pyrophosphatase YjhB (NUDIX family)
MKFCSGCGAQVVNRIPPGDDRPRFVCDVCDTIHYSNPKIVAGCIPEWEGRILLCRRAIEPRAGLWTLPAGFMENQETTQEAAARETLEEACARVEVGELFTYLNVPRISQVYVMFRARLLDQDFGAGPESLEVALFEESQIPWEALAFKSIDITLRRYFADRASGAFGTHVVDVHHTPRRG